MVLLEQGGEGLGFEDVEGEAWSVGVVVEGTSDGGDLVAGLAEVEGRGGVSVGDAELVEVGEDGEGAEAGGACLEGLE